MRDELIDVVQQHEDFRHKCEVRSLLRTAADAGHWGAVQRYYEMVERKRGREMREKLAKDVRAQWLAGNRGEQGNWQ